MAQEKINAGDVVILKSHPEIKMTVSYIDGDSAMCVWFGKELQILAQKLSLASLETVKK